MTLSLSGNGITSANIVDDAITLAKMASGTDGEIITYDANGDPASVSVGTSGQVLTSNGTGAAPTFQAAGGGITEADEWYLTTSFDGNAAPIASNLSRSAATAFGLLGTGMTQSSGIFTFPSTGIWLVGFNMTFSENGDDRNISAIIEATLDNSSYSAQQAGRAFIKQSESNITTISTYIDAIIDVTNTSNVKVRFSTSGVNAGTTVVSSSKMTFIRLGDT